MNNIQKFIKIIKTEKEIAEKEAEDWKHDKPYSADQRARASAISFCLQWAEMLLKNTENENGGKKDASNDGKPMLNRTPPVRRGDFGYICLFKYKKIKLCKKNKGRAAYHARGSYCSTEKVK